MRTPKRFHGSLPPAMWAVLFAVACAGVKQAPGGADAAARGTGGNAVATGAGGSAPAGAGGSSGTGPARDGGATDVACVPKVTTCTQPGGTYCGTIGNGCAGGKLVCPDCPTGYTCTDGICVGGASCPAIGCGAYCGDIGDGCGRSLKCGGCSGNNQCNAGVCASPGCVPLTCAPSAGTRYCGKIGDGCGGTLDCQTCPGGMVCGSGGIANLCVDPNCTPVTCTPTGGQYCGTIGNGCGGVLNCGECANGMACGGGGTPHVCPGTAGGGCTGLQCQVATCTGGATTSLSGVVYDPAGKVPLYNVTVYVPNDAPDPIPEGVSCDKCSAQVSGHPVAATLTDAGGAFRLTGVPSGSNIPLVMQVGKWRRQVTIPTVTACVDNKVTDVNLTRLPRTQAEGHLPKIAVTTGGSDAIECFLREVGIADTEFTTDTGRGRVNLFVGGDAAAGKGQGSSSFSAALGGAAFPQATALWSNVDELLGYDILMHSCEGSQYPDVKSPYVANIKRYADSGGRLFNDHLHFYWLRNGPVPWPTTAVYLGAQSDLTSPVTATIDTSFPKGAAFGQWLVNTGATPTAGSIALYGSQHSVQSTTAPTSQQWLYIPASGAIQRSVQYLTINTPVEAAADNQCGRVVLTDIHVKEAPPPSGGSKDDSDPSKPFPTGCKATSLSGQAKALEFLFFDLSACIQPDSSKPQPPVVPPPGTPSSPPPSVTPPPPAPPPPPPPPPIVIDQP